MGKRKGGLHSYHIAYPEAHGTQFMFVRHTMDNTLDAWESHLIHKMPTQRNFSPAFYLYSFEKMLSSSVLRV